MLNELRIMQNLMDTILRNAEAQFEEIRSIQTKPIQLQEGPGLKIINNDNEIIATARVSPNTNVNLTPNRLEISSENRTNNMISSFYQLISLPNIDPNMAKTSYNNGMLEIRIPKKMTGFQKRLSLLPGRITEVK